MPNSETWTEEFAEKLVRIVEEAWERKGIPEEEKNKLCNAFCAYVDEQIVAKGREAK